MPTLFRFLFVTGTLVATVFAGLYILATRFEPEPRHTVYRLQDVKTNGLMPTQEAPPAEKGGTADQNEGAKDAGAPTTAQTE